MPDFKKITKTPTAGVQTLFPVSDGAVLSVNTRYIMAGSGFTLHLPEANSVRLHEIVEIYFDAGSSANVEDRDTENDLIQEFSCYGDSGAGATGMVIKYSFITQSLSSGGQGWKHMTNSSINYTLDVSGKRIVKWKPDDITSQKILDRWFGQVELLATDFTDDGYDEITIIDDSDVNDPEGPMSLNVDGHLPLGTKLNFVVKRGHGFTLDLISSGLFIGHVESGNDSRYTRIVRESSPTSPVSVLSLIYQPYDVGTIDHVWFIMATTDENWTLTNP